MKNLLFCLLFVGGLFTMKTQAQSPWTKEKGEGYTQLSYTFLPAYSSLFEGGGEFRETARKITDHTVQFYGEYGLTNGTTAIAVLPLKVLGAKGIVDNGPTPVIPEGNSVTPGDIQLGIRQKIYDKSFVAAGQLLLDIPTGAYDNQSLSGLRSGYRELAIKPSLSIGGGFGKGYAYAFSGVNIQTNNISHSVKSGIEGGYKILGNVYLIGFLEMLNSFKNKPSDGTASNIQTGLYLNNQEYFAFGLKVFSELTDNVGITTSFAGAFSGNNVAGAPAINFGVFYKWKKKEKLQSN